MKALAASIIAVCGLYVLGAAQRSSPPDLPALHRVQEVTLSPSYSCRASEDFQKGYEKTALFLSEFARRQNSPDLLFNGACGSEDSFEASTAGDDMSLIADLGENVALEEITASRSFNLQRLHSFPAYSKFSSIVKVEPKHSYAVLINKRDKRGLFVFTVDEYQANKKVHLRYAVKSYQVTTGVALSSAGFSWDQKNTP